MIEKRQHYFLFLGVLEDGGESLLNGRYEFFGNNSLESFSFDILLLLPQLQKQLIGDVEYEPFPGDQEV